jgi:hypothetical protein
MGRRGVRRSQAVVPFGVGAIVDFEDEALMSAGLDAWPDESSQDCLFDDRLAARLGVKYFRQPPAAEGEDIVPIPYVRFPFWHFCPRCRALHRLKGNEQRRPQCESSTESPARKLGPPCGELPAKKRRRVLPLRFVLACPEGHIEDFPWVEWAHTEKGTPLRRGATCEAPRMYFYPTQLGGLAGLLIQCAACERKRSLLGATGELRGFTCGGARPWLGPSANEACASPRPPWVLQRGASNVYFPGVESSVLIPPFSKAVRRIVDNPRLWEAITAQRDDGRIPDAHINIAAVQNGVPFDELKAAVVAKDTGEGLGPVDQTEAEYRFDEYRALSRVNIENGDYLVTRPQDMSEYDTFARSVLDSVVLVESLAETRALKGFSRIADAASANALSLARKDWRPAYRVHGEGLFLIFKQQLFDAWGIGDALDKVSAKGTRETRIRLQPASAELVALHTLAHLLILQLSFDAGYGASSIRERLYSASTTSTTPMRGILLYTAAGDAEGTLGGLVRLGKAGRLERILKRAIISAQWCSADPVCRESPGQGVGSLNLAACHACGLLPETSCETGNRLLDRLSLVGRPELGERPGLFRQFID